MSHPFLALITPLSHLPGGGQGPVDPGYSPPWAQVPGGGQPQPPLGIWGPTDPRPTHPISGWNPGTGQFPGQGGPVDPGYSPPWAQVPGAKPQVYSGVKESSIPEHPDKPTGESGEWVLVATGPNQVNWAWMEGSATTPPPTGGTPPQPPGATHPIQPTVPQPKK